MGDEIRNIRHIDEDAYIEARFEAMKRHMLIGVWITEAIREKLGRARKEAT